MNYEKVCWKYAPMIRGIAMVCGAQGKEQIWCPLIFLFTYFCQKVDPLKTCMVKSDKQTNKTKQKH